MTSYPEPQGSDDRPLEDRCRDAEAAARQVAELERRRRDDGSRRELLTLLQSRREGREDLPQIEIVNDPGGDEVLCVSQQLVTTGEAIKDPRMQRLLDRLGLRPQPVDELDGRVAKLHAPGREWPELVTLARRLRTTGHPVSLTWVTPLGIVMKAGITPEQSAGAAPTPRGEGGGSVRVAVVDNGVADQERTDGWVQGLVQPGNVDRLDDLPGTGDGFLDAGAGHGTFVAGVVQQVAPAAPITAYRALDSDGIGSEVDVAVALVRAVRENLEPGGRLVVNLSLGSETLDDEPPVSLEIALDMVDELQVRQRGEVLVVAAAGNEGRERECWPAAFDRVVAVGGLTAALRPADWSSRGHWVDCSTVGTGVRGPYPAGAESPDFDSAPETFGPDAWALWTGTSFAAPQVAGAVAAIAEAEGISLRAALLRLLDGRPRLRGFGRVVGLLPGA